MAFKLQVIRNASVTQHDLQTALTPSEVKKLRKGDKFTFARGSTSYFKMTSDALPLKSGEVVLSYSFVDSRGNERQDATTLVTAEHILDREAAPFDERTAARVGRLAKHDFGQVRVVGTGTVEELQRVLNGAASNMSEVVIG